MRAVLKGSFFLGGGTVPSCYGGFPFWRVGIVGRTSRIPIFHGNGIGRSLWHEEGVNIDRGPEIKF